MGKRYVIIADSLSNMGGAQMYIRNKMLYLRNQGWSVTITAAKAKNIIIPELKEINHIIPELQYCKYYYRKGIQKRISEKLSKIVADRDYEEIIIESTSIVQSTWAETVAQKVGARHIVYLLQERNDVDNQGLREYFLFKHSRHELVGITTRTISDMFKPFHPIPDGESYCLSAHCSNVEADVDCLFLHQIDSNCYDHIVGALSRLDKPYVPYVVDDVCNFASLHQNKKFLLLWIGDAPKDAPIISKVKERVQKNNNVELIITGYLYPVPTRLLEMCHVIISSSGSSIVSKRSGVPTITYDGKDFQPIGILGRTTQNFLFRGEDESPQKLDDILNQILIDKKYTKLPSNYQADLPDFKSHLDFLKEASQRLEYYDMETIKPKSKLEKKVELGLFLIGPNGYAELHNLKRRVFSISFFR
ncbi:MAG: hypothetical protein J6W13_05710 [Salinivirgaceae bacterium]|nr:hypothetical protein [Salinivirgaceae bacterium]